MSRNSRHSKYGFKINSNIKIPLSQFSVFDIRQRRFKHRSIAHRLLSCSGLHRLRPISITAVRFVAWQAIVTSAMKRFEAIAIADYRSPCHAKCSRNENRPLVYKMYMQHKTLTSTRRMEYSRVERVLSSKLRRAPPAADRQGGRQPVVQFPLGGGGGRTHRPLLPAPHVILGRSCASPACLHLASPMTRSYKSTETQRAAHLNARVNRYPDFYRISRFDIRINKKFDTNITSR